MKSQSLVQCLRIPCSFSFKWRITTKRDQTAANSFGEGRGLDYKDSPTWITQFKVWMRKLWCLEDDKVGEKISALIFKFSSCLMNKWERENI